MTEAPKTRSPSRVLLVDRHLIFTNIRDWYAEGGDIYSLYRTHGESHHGITPMWAKKWRDQWMIDRNYDLVDENNPEFNEDSDPHYDEREDALNEEEKNCYVL